MTEPVEHTTENWKNWNEPSVTSVVLWASKLGGRKTTAYARDGWRSVNTGPDTWSELLDRIAKHGDGTPPRIIDPWAEPIDPLATPERVVVWKTGDPIDKLRAYTGRAGVEVRAEHGSTVLSGPLRGVDASLARITIGQVATVEQLWNIVVTAPKPARAPWWQVESITPGHVVSWTHAVTGDRQVIVWWGWSKLAEWRTNWDGCADPATWRVTEVHAAGGPKLIAWNATAEEDLA